MLFFDVFDLIKEVSKKNQSVKTWELVGLFIVDFFFIPLLNHLEFAHYYH